MMNSRQRYAIPRGARNIIGLRLNISYAFILDCSQLFELISFDILRKIYELKGPQAAFEYWFSGIYIDNLGKMMHAIYTNNIIRYFFSNKTLL